MLLYVIPFVLLLVIAIVLKKRENANKENANANAKKTNNKKTTKKNVARTARTSQAQHTNVVEDDNIVVKQATKSLSPELKKNIDSLIAEKNYFSAEAKINQALNQDNSQHELYLYLLDVHLAQKDEFAVNQLINHIRSLGLDDIVAQAEAKQKTAHSEKTVDTIAFEPSTPTATETHKSISAFDALIEKTETTVESQKYVDSEALQFNTDTVEKTTEIHQEQKPLEFNFNSTAQTEPTPNAEFSFETPASVEETKPEIAPLEFSFSSNEPTPVVEKTAEVDASPEFKLDFAEPHVAPVIEEKVPVQDLEFTLTPSQKEAQPEFHFDLEQKTETTEQVIETPAALNVEAPNQAIAETAKVVDSTDPLVKSFPELAQINEIELNLELAQQYINLGSYASARALLSQDEATYTPEQRQHSQNLLNQIAS